MKQQKLLEKLINLYCQNDLIRSVFSAPKDQSLQISFLYSDFTELKGFSFNDYNAFWHGVNNMDCCFLKSPGFDAGKLARMKFEELMKFKFTAEIIK